MEAPGQEGTMWSRAKERAAAEYGKGYDPYPNDDKKAQMAFGCGTGVPEDCGFINRLKGDLANSYYWSGEMFTDYFFFVAQWHPWLGILLCHPNHPWTKIERLLMMVISLAISIVPSAVIVKQAGDDAVATAKILTILFVTIPNVLFGVLAYQIAIADTRCPHCAPCCVCCKNCLFCITIVFATAMTTAAWGISKADESAEHKVDWMEMTQPLWVAQLQSAIIWFPLWIILPCQLGFWSLWRDERNAMEQGILAAGPE